MQHGFHVYTHGVLGGFHRFGRVMFLFVDVLLPGPAGRQIAVQRIVGRGLVGHRIRADAAANQFRQDFGGIAEQRNRHRFSFSAVFLDAGQRVVQIMGLFVHIPGLDAHIDARLLAFDIERAGTGHAGGQGLRTAHAAQTGGQNPFSGEIAGIVLTPHLNEGFKRALHDALRTDVYPRTGGHLAVHHQTFFVEFVEVFPGRPVRHQIGVGQQHTRRIRVRGEYTDRLTALDQQGFVVVEGFQGGQNGVEAGPIAGSAADAAVHHQTLRIFGHCRIQIVLDHAERGFGQPGFAGQCGPYRRTDDATGVETGIGHGRNSKGLPAL